MDMKKWQDIQANIQELCNEYGTKYYNYLNDPRFNPEDFVDHDHLNKNGAGKFSGVLEREVIEQEFPVP